MNREQSSLSPLENEAMQVVWSLGRCSADDVRQVLAGSRPLKDSTVRTLLRRMEEKGYLKHIVEGRTYFYQPVVPREKVATTAIRLIIDRFCGGSVEALLVGMVGDRLVDKEQLLELVGRIAESEPAAEESHE
ncbi:MAG TPA: BlaI/MecI/CopY family transcriptional regulator [Thermoanaerobaculia bacterium]|jgi:predicted transcriptional regulator|nr:BlaI/MecI/CopY family transcriptional regulator [Thermoanaerobaculia bacterium]